MCPYDYTDAPPPRDLELIPHGTIATLVLHVRPGGVGEDGMLKRTRAGDAEMLDCELVVADGPHAKRKFWERWILNGTTAGQAQAAEIARSVLRAIPDSALGLKPDDVSPQARAARTVSLGQFEGMTFMGKIGIEKGRPKNDGTGENWSTRTSSRQSSHPTRKSGTRASSRRRSMVVGPRAPPRLPSLHLPSSGRGGRREKEEDPHRRRGLAVRARRSVAAGRYCLCHCSNTWGRPDGWPHSVRHAGRAIKRY